MGNGWLRENMLTILSLIGVAATLSVVGIFVLYYMLKKKAKKKAEESS